MGKLVSSLAIFTFAAAAGIALLAMGCSPDGGADPPVANPEGFAAPRVPPVPSPAPLPQLPEAPPAAPQGTLLPTPAIEPGGEDRAAEDAAEAFEAPPVERPSALEYGEPSDPALPRANPLRPELPPQPLRDTEGFRPEAEPPADEEARDDAPPYEDVGKGGVAFGKRGHPPFDPIKENGPIFVDWPDPQAALVITGRQDGYLEPCGCAGLDRMQGGLGRRQTMIAMLREEFGWPVAAVDVGGLVKGFGRQAEMKLHLTLEAMRRMRYDAVAFGLSDLRFPAAELLSVALGVDGEPGPFVSANAALFDFDAELTDRVRIVESGGLRFGITSVFGEEYQADLRNEEVVLRDPAAALEEVVPTIEAEADVLVLLAHATVEESMALARRFPQFGVVVTSDGPGTPPGEPRKIDGTESLLVQVGDKGMNVIVLGFYDDPVHPVRYQRVPLDSRFAGSRDAHLLMSAYQDQLRELGLEGLGLGRPAPHPQRETHGEFVGSQRCESCHDISYDIWRRTPHAKAWETLVELDPQRTHDPECISCHVMGWHPTQYFPYEGGFWSEEQTPHLVGVGCEACHGPGGNHVAAEMGSDAALQEKYRSLMVITKEDSREHQCTSCHDLDNSPDFDFDTYWPHVEHYEY